MSLSCWGKRGGLSCCCCCCCKLLAEERWLLLLLGHTDARNKLTAATTTHIQIIDTYTNTKHKQKGMHKCKFTYTYVLTQTHNDTDKHTHWIIQNKLATATPTHSISITDSWPEALFQILFSVHKHKHSSADNHFAAVHQPRSKAFLLPQLLAIIQSH